METNSKTGRRQAVQTKYEPTNEERQDIIQTLSDSAFMLFQYYLRMATIPDSIMEDINAATYFHWDISKVSRLRRALEKENYFRRITFTANSGKKSTTYYIGKDIVSRL